MDKRVLVRGLIAEVGLPAVVYYGCRLVGVDSWFALAAGGVVALIRVGYVGVTRRRLDGLAAVMAAVFALLLVASWLTGDPRVLLARESIVSGAVGILALGSCAAGRPVIYTVIRRLNEGNVEALARWEEMWQIRPAFRRAFMVRTTVWGAGLLAEAVLRLPLIFVLPVDTMAGLSTVLELGTLAVLVSWDIRYRRRHRDVTQSVPVTSPSVPEAHRAR